MEKLYQIKLNNPFKISFTECLQSHLDKNNCLTGKLIYDSDNFLRFHYATHNINAFYNYYILDKVENTGYLNIFRIKANNMYRISNFNFYTEEFTVSLLHDAFTNIEEQQKSILESYDMKAYDGALAVVTMLEISGEENICLFS